MPFVCGFVRPFVLDCMLQGRLPQLGEDWESRRAASLETGWKECPRATVLGRVQFRAPHRDRIELAGRQSSNVSCI